MRRVYRGTWAPEHRTESIYQYLPVDLPPGAAGLRVTLTYDREAGVLDLGCVGAAGFRGWSGGARTSYVITREAATPGYLPGQLEPGVWQVMLGLHRVGEQGVAYEVTAEVGSFDLPAIPAPPPIPERPPQRDLPATAGRRWLAGDLHAHTVHSDGVLTIDGLAALAASRGLDFLAVTDHNTTSHHPHLPAAAARAGLLLIPGQELTTDTGHANCFGDVGWIDFRSDYDRWLADAEERGGLLSINHPLAGDSAWRRPLTRKPPLAEVWHSSWALWPQWQEPVHWWRDWGLDVTAVGGSDWHRPGSDAAPGAPTTWVECDDSDVLGGFRAGRTTISAQPTGPVLVPCDGELLAIEAEGTTHIDDSGRRTPVTSERQSLSASDGPHRLVAADDAVLALTAGPDTPRG